MLTAVYQVAIPAPDITPVLLIYEMVQSIDGDVDDVRVMLATILASVVFSTALIALVFFLLGRFNAGRFVHFVPAVIIYGFFGAIGYKVLKSALIIGVGKEYMFHPSESIFWKLFIVSFLLGAALYVGKRRHWNASILFPVLLGAPIIVFHVILLISGTSVEEARSAGAHRTLYFDRQGENV